jgi:lipoprotein
MKTLRILLLTTLAMSFLAGCGGNSEDAEWEADILKEKCARAKKHNWKLDECPQNSD